MDTKGKGEPWGPLPVGIGANPLIRRLKAIDAEIRGNLYAHTGTLGSLSIEGWITTGVGGGFRTGTSGAHVTIASSSANTINFYSGLSTELNPGGIYTLSAGSLGLISPALSSYGSAPAIFLVPTGEIQLSPGSLFPYTTLKAGAFRVPDGTASVPSYSFTNNSTMGVYRVSSGVMGFSVSSQKVASISSSGINASGGFTLPVKTTTGDPASPAEGYTYVNTSDKKVRTYAGSAWRDLVTW